jgi:hypothetical protein
MNIKELREIAEAATPGPWAVDPEDEHHVIDVPEQEGSVIDFQEGRIGYALMNPANATYAATFNPYRVKALLDCVEALERIGRIGGLDGAEDGQLVEYDGVWASITARAALKALEAT